MINKKKKRILYLSLFSISLFIIAMFIQSNISLINSNMNGKIISGDNGQIDEDDGIYNLRISGYENPIVINGSATGVGAQNWTWAKGQPWCTGDGTESVPYIIEDLIINGEGYDQCIAIYNSNAYFIIRNCTVYNSDSTYQDSGIKLYKVKNGKLMNNYCLNNSVGIRLNQSSYNTISGNNAYNNSNYGIRVLDNSTYNLITENTINMNLVNGLEIYTSDSISLRCKYNIISKNNISSNDYKGMFLDNSDYNNITQNIINNSGYEGMHLRYSDSNLIFKNYFINNPNHAEDEEHPFIHGENYWNNSVIGNYWDNHSTGDADGDGIDDTSYTYIPGNVDPPPVVDYLPIYGNPFHDGSKVHIDGNYGSGNASWNWVSTRAWCSGSGTSGDPYIISDLEIDAGSVGSCILIGNSSVYFIIENCNLSNSGSGSMDGGIKLDTVSNAQLIGNNCSSNYCGISLYLSDNNDVMENILQENTYGICLNESDSNSITENSFIWNTDYALEENCSGNTFENNYCIPPLTIVNVTSTNIDGTYRFGEIIEITIEFSDKVYITGTPQLTLETGDTDAVVNYTSGDGTDTLSFNYTVDLEHYSPDLDYISINALSGTIEGIVGNSANLTLPTPGDFGSLSYNKDIYVDAQTPTITNVSSTNLNGIYGIDEVIEITITFSEVVNVSGTPQLRLETGTTDVYVDYTSGNQTDTLTFTYTVAFGDDSSDLDYYSTTALSGMITDLDGLDADLTLPTPGNPGSLSDNKDIIVDAIDPASPSGLSATPSSWTSADDFDVSWTNPADTSGIAGVYYKLDVAPTTDTDGTYIAGAGITSITGINVGTDGIHTIYVWLKDGAGNVDYTHYDSVDVYLDATDPSSPSGLSATPSSWTSVDDFDASWTNPADTSGIAGVYYKLDVAPTTDTDGTYIAGAGITSITGINVGSDGTHTIYVWLRDGAGNVDYTHYDSVEVYLDATDPSSPSGLSATPSSWTSVDDFDVSWINPADTSGIAGVYYKLDVAPTSDTDGTYIASAGITSITGINVGTDGTHTIYVWLRDTAGNVDYTHYDSVEVYLDTIDPASPSGLSATPSSWTSVDDFDASWTNPADTSGIAGVYYKLDVAPTTDTDGTYIAGAGITSITGINVGTDGTHTIYIWLRDTAGNVDYTHYDSVEVYLDTIDPASPSGISATPSSWTSVDDFDVSWANPADTSGIAGVYYKLDVAPTMDTDGTYIAGAGITSITGINVGTDGTHTIYVWLRDGAGNVDYTTNALTQLYLDTTNPSVINVSATNSNGSYGIDNELYITIIFSESVFVSGTPRLTLETGSVDALIDYTGGNGTNTLIFTYTVISGHNSTDLDYLSTNALSLNGGTIKDAVGNDADLVLPAPGALGSLGYNKDIIIETIPPEVTNVTSSKPDGRYGIGEVIYIIVNFSETVYVTGIPQITLETGTMDAIINYNTGSGTDSLIFTYIVALGHDSPDLDYISINALSLNGGTIRDLAGNNANVTLPPPGALGSLSDNKGLIIEAIAPTVVTVSANNPDGTYGIGDVINITIIFSKPVYVSGTPQLILETGSINAVVRYTTGSGTNTLIFSYLVASGHESEDLDYESINALSLNGGTIKDSVGNDAILTLPAPGTVGSLGANKDLIIDTRETPDIIGWVFVIAIGSFAGIVIVGVIIIMRRRRS